MAPDQIESATLWHQIRLRVPLCGIRLDLRVPLCGIRLELRVPFLVSKPLPDHQSCPPTPLWLNASRLRPARCVWGGGGGNQRFYILLWGCGPKVLNLTVGCGPKVLHLTVGVWTKGFKSYCGGWTKGFTSYCEGGPKVLHLIVGVWTKGFTSYWGRYSNILISNRKLLFSVQAGAVIALCVCVGGGGGGIIIKDSN